MRSSSSRLALAMAVSATMEYVMDFNFVMPLSFVAKAVSFDASAPLLHDGLGDPLIDDPPMAEGLATWSIESQASGRTWMNEVSFMRRGTATLYCALASRSSMAWRLPSSPSSPPCASGNASGSDGLGLLDASFEMTIGGAQRVGGRYHHRPGYWHCGPSHRELRCLHPGGVLRNGGGHPVVLGCPALSGAGAREPGGK